MDQRIQILNFSKSPNFKQDYKNPISQNSKKDHKNPKIKQFFLNGSKELKI